MCVLLHVFTLIAILIQYTHIDDQIYLSLLHIKSWMLCLGVQTIAYEYYNKSNITQTYWFHYNL